MSSKQIVTIVGAIFYVAVVSIIFVLNSCGTDGSLAIVKHYGCTINNEQLICADGTGFDLSTLEGTDGISGIDGLDGLQGQPGEDGEDGYNSLIEITEICCKFKGDSKIVACVNPNICLKHGYIIEAGLDFNRDGSLQDDETTSSARICN